MQNVQQAVVSLTDAEGFASGCLILASCARAIATERQRFGMSGDQFNELAEVLEMRATGNQRAVGPRESGRRQGLRLVQE